MQVIPVGTGDVGGLQVRVIVVKLPRMGVKVKLIVAEEPAGIGAGLLGRLAVKSAWPVPVRDADRVVAAAPAVVTMRVPVRVPEITGVKVMEMAQVPLAGMLVPQVLV